MKIFETFSVALCIMSSVLLTACGNPVVSSSTAPSGSAAPSALPMPSSGSSQSDVTLHEGSMLVNQTADMTLQALTYKDGADGLHSDCAPGESLPLRGQLASFAYTTPEFTGTQEFADIYLYSKEDSTIVFSGDAQAGYTFVVYDDEQEVPVHRYALEPVQHVWLPFKEGQKLFTMELPQLPMDEILEMYPNAVLPDGHREVQWPDGYIRMFWCDEPLYNLKMGDSGVAGLGPDGELSYFPVDWASIEGITLLPGAPLFSGVVSVGSAWNLVVRFADAKGTEYTYLMGENGRGGDYPGLYFYQLDGVLFAEA